MIQFRYDTDFGLQTLEDLIKLNNRIAEIIEVWQPSQVFLEASASENAEFQKLNAQGAGHSRLTGIKEVYSEVLMTLKSFGMFCFTYIVPLFRLLY